MALSIWQFPNTITFSLAVLLSTGFGIALLRGSLRATAWVRGGSLFLFVACTGVMLAGLLSQPLALTLTQFQLASRNPVRIGVEGLTLTLNLALFLYLSVSLNQASVRAARSAAGRPALGIKLPVSLGVALSLAFLLTLYGVQHSPAADRARMEAQHQLGSGYRFQVSSLTTSLGAQSADGAWSAKVLAWKENEIREIRVQSER